MSTSFIHIPTKLTLFPVLLSLLLLVPNSQIKALEFQLENGMNLKLFGIGLHQEKRNDIYVGALFAPEYITNSSQLFEISADKRMSLKFISKYSNRKMTRFWKQRIAMNNSKSNWQPLTKEIIQFANIFKQPMQKGDEINIDFSLDIGTSVYLNETLFLTIKNLQFYELLLNIWVGSIPPSEAFKTGITGKNSASINEQLIDQYKNLQPVVGRFKLDDVEKKSTQVASTSSKPKENKVVTAKNTVVQKKSPVKNETIEKPKTRLAADNKKTTTSVPIPLPKLNVTKPPVFDSASSKLPTNTITPKKSATKTTTIKEKQNDTPQKQRVQVKNTPPKSKKVKEKVAKLDIPKEPFFDADLFSGAYTLELINAIRKYQSYPRKALTAGDEGDVVIQIKIDSQGEILDSNIIKRSGSRILDRAVLRMVRKAEPFPEIPKELKVSEFEFEVPMSFHLSNN